MIAESAKNPANGASSEAREVVMLFRQHWAVVAFWVLLALGAAAVYLHVARPVYESQGLLEVVIGGKAAESDTDSIDLLRTLQLKIADQSVLLAVARENHLASDPDFSPGPEPEAESELVRRLGRQISVGLVRGSRLISVSAEAHDPGLAQRLANSVIETFFAQSKSAEDQYDVSSRDRLLAEAKRLGADVAAAEGRLQAYREKYHAVSLEERQDIVVERLRALNTEVAEAKNARLAMEPDRDRIRRLAGSAPEQLLNVRGIASLPEVIDLRQKATDQEARVAMLSKRYGPLYPTMIQARSQLDDLRRSLDSSIRKAAGLVLQSYAAALATENSLEHELARQEQAALELDRIAIPYHQYEREVDADTATYRQILDKLSQTDANRALVSDTDVDGNRIQVLERPLWPVHPASPVKKLWMAGALAAGLVLGGFSVLATRAFDETFSSVDATEEKLGLPVLATVPESSHRKLASGSLLMKRPTSPEAEAFRSLRTALSLPGGSEERRCVMFTSAVPGEGKSYCSLNYAAALAQQGSRTLLIDGDLRRPQQLAADTGRSVLQRMLAPARSAKPSLTDCIRDPELFARAVQVTAIQNLFLLGDPRGRPNAGELVAKDGLKEILGRALATFDRVVVDSAPVLAVSDGLHIARNVPTVCLVVHAASTTRRQAARACRLLRDMAGRTPTGVVLNKISRGPASGYHYYYSDKSYA